MSSETFELEVKSNLFIGEFAHPQKFCKNQIKNSI